MSNFDVMIDMVRIVLYLTVAVESGTLAILYGMAYKAMKQSDIILAISRMFGALCINFLWVASVPIIGIFDRHASEIAADWLVIPIILTLISITHFRVCSLDNKLIKLNKEARKKRPL